MKVKVSRTACHFFRVPLQRRKKNAPQHTFLAGKHVKRLPAFCGKRPSFSLPPPLSDPRHAQRCGERTSRVCAYTRTPQSVFVFCLHPSRWGLSSLIARALGVKTPPFFSSFTTAPGVCSQGEGREAKAFTPYALTVNALTQVGEEVKAKNEKCLTRARVGA